jgi:hypothetical protein
MPVTSRLRANGHIRLSVRTSTYVRPLLSVGHLAAQAGRGRDHYSVAARPACQRDHPALMAGPPTTSTITPIRTFVPATPMRLATSSPRSTKGPRTFRSSRPRDQRTQHEQPEPHPEDSGHVGGHRHGRHAVCRPTARLPARLSLMLCERRVSCAAGGPSWGSGGQARLVRRPRRR